MVEKYFLSKFIFGFLILICFYNISLAQSKNIVLKNDTAINKVVNNNTKTDRLKKTYFEASFNYLSDIVYNGRHDSLSTNYFTPMLGYYNQSGIYITGSLSYMKTARESRIDLFDLTAGYDFTIIEDKLTGGIYGDKYFYNQSSTAIKSDEKGGIGANLSTDFNFITLFCGVDMIFSSKTDISSNLSLSHEFKIEGKNASSWTLTPTASVNMSTLNYYEDYTNRKIGKNAQKRTPNLISIKSETSINNHNGFTLLDYELQLPLSYDDKTWGLSFTPYLAFPLNPIFTTTKSTYTFKNRAPAVTTIDSTPTTEKNLKPNFYFELEVHIKLFGGHDETK